MAPYEALPLHSSNGGGGGEGSTSGSPTHTPSLNGGLKQTLWKHMPIGAQAEPGGGVTIRLVLQSRTGKLFLTGLLSLVILLGVFASTKGGDVIRNLRPKMPPPSFRKIADRPDRGYGSNDELVEPHYEKDSTTGYLYPPDVFIGTNPYKRAKAAIVALVRNEELWQMVSSMRSVEERFNRKYGYPWVFMNEEPFSIEFTNTVRGMTRGEVKFVTIPKEHWSYPSNINQTYAAEERKKMETEGVIYGGSESYRHMCRFNSGFFFQQRELQEYDYYWRVEPGVDLYVDLDYDPFLFMKANNKVYGFVIALYEYKRTIESLWDHVRKFAKAHPEHIAKPNSVHFMVDEKALGLDGDYNLCHFWSNFEIADMRFWRGQAYQDFFNYLDETGNFFYERWGDAPVHSIAAALFLPPEQIHFCTPNRRFHRLWTLTYAEKIAAVEDIGYRHNPYVHCPKNPNWYLSGKTNCPRENNFDYQGYSCLRQWERVGKLYGLPAS